MVREIARKYALQNAVLHGGIADGRAVIGKMLAEEPALRARAREIIPEVEAVVREVNALGPEAQRAELERLAPELGSIYSSSEAAHAPLAARRSSNHDHPRNSEAE